MAFWDSCAAELLLDAAVCISRADNSPPKAVARTEGVPSSLFEFQLQAAKHSCL